MKYLTYHQLKALWIKFFVEQQHQLVPAVNLVNQDDSLLWINSGIAGLKDFFLGVRQPPAKRLVNIQKSLRTNDINLIGQTNRHLTLFEMMGNFAIGDYFKQSAIKWAYTFLTGAKWLALPTTKLYFTVWEKDQTTLQILQHELKIPVNRILLKSKKTNFWDLGVGPCGPNLEIFYDLGPTFDPNQQGIQLLIDDLENDRYLEIWNIVFTQFNHIKSNQYVTLAHKNIDTGAGLERLLMVLQSQNQLFTIDLFAPLIQFLEQATAVRFHNLPFGQLAKSDQANNRAFAIIVDHLRAAVFMLADLHASQINWTFQNQHGYIVRRLIRRALVQLYFLKIKLPFLTKLVPLIVQYHQADYPELATFAAQISKLIAAEEQQVHKLWKPAVFEQLFGGQTKHITGQQLFDLVTSQGLSLDLLKMFAEQTGVRLELTGFEKLWIKHQQISQGKATTNLTSAVAVLASPNPTKTVFLETSTVMTANILAVFPTKIPDQVWVIFDQTLFYAEQGGQAADSGTIMIDQTAMLVLDVQLNNFQQHLHLIQTHHQRLSVGQTAQLLLNQSQRQLTAKNHSATHLLHATLRQRFGSSLQQAGSFNNQDYLRLDFTFNRKLSLSDLAAIEAAVVKIIHQQIKPQIKHCSLAAAQQQGVLAFFTDRYRNPLVRIVQFGDFSAELCGGTHVLQTGLIQRFLITNYQTVGNNRHRIYALTDEQTITNYLTKAHAKFNPIWNAAQTFRQATTASPITALLRKITATRFFLTQKQHYAELATYVKDFQRKAESQQIVQLVTDYQLPVTATVVINQQKFCFQSVEIAQPVNGAAVLKLLHQRLANQFRGMVLIFPNLATNQHALLIQSPSLRFLQKTLEFLNQPTANWSTKFGFNKSKIQGVLKTPIPQIKLFLSALKAQFKA